MHNAGVAEGYSEEANALWLDFSRKSKKMQISTVVGILTSLKLNISSSNQSRLKPTLRKQNSQAFLKQHLPHSLPPYHSTLNNVRLSLLPMKSSDKVPASCL